MKIRIGKTGNCQKEEILRMQELSRRFFQGKTPRSLYSSCSYVMQTKGKYIRPLIFLLSIRLLGGKLRHSYEIGFAIETLHRASLVFDDIMDDSNTRHGREALHEKKGLNNALLTGFCLLPLSYDILLRDSPSGMSVGAIGIVNKALLHMNEGQAVDIEQKSSVTMSDYELMIYKKTASLIEASCILGAYFSKASKKDMRALANYGKYVGMAFQIRDDLYDVLADEKRLGKPTGNDINGKKKTYLRTVCIEKGKKYKNQLLKLEENREKLSQTELLNSYLQVYMDSGAIEDARTRIKFYSGLAKKSLSAFPTSKYKEAMISIAEHLTADF